MRFIEGEEKNGISYKPSTWAFSEDDKDFHFRPHQRESAGIWSGGESITHRTEGAKFKCAPQGQPCGTSGDFSATPLTFAEG
jgi:hypothetical protein